MIKAVFFDLDGTLVDSRADLTTAINLMRGDYGLSPLSIVSISSFVGNGIKKLVQRSLVGEKVDFAEALATFNFYYADHLADQTVCYPGVIELLDFLMAHNYKIAIVTNKNIEPTNQVLQALGLAKYFDFVACGDSFDKCKPDPCQINNLILKMQLDKNQILMVGDHDTDIEAAYHAGVKSVFFENGIGKLGHIKPDFTIDSMNLLIDLICK